MDRILRPYSKEEIKLLRTRKFSAWKHFENFGMKWIGTTIVFIAPLLLFEKFIKEIPPSTELPIVIVLELIAISLVLYWMKKSGELDWNRNIEKEIKSGQAEVITIKTDTVVKRKDPEDFGSGYYLKISDSKTLYLQCQYYDELQYSRKFPNTDFSIVRSKQTGELIDIKSEGKYLKPTRKIEPFTKEQYKTGLIHYDGDVLELSIDDIK
jgi:hypothetical protein